MMEVHTLRLAKNSCISDGNLWSVGVVTAILTNLSLYFTAEGLISNFFLSYGVSLFWCMLLINIQDFIQMSDSAETAALNSNVKMAK